MEDKKLRKQAVAQKVPGITAGTSEAAPGTSEESGGLRQIEDKVMKTAARFFGEDLLPYIGVKGRIDRIAPTEYVHLDMRRLEDDFNFIMENGLWRHLEFESDSIKVCDLRRFREYEAYISLVYNVPVVTTVLCTSSVKVLRKELVNGWNTYRVELVRLKDRNADTVFEKLENRIQSKKVLRRRHVFPVLLTPMMSGKMEMCERICRGMDILQREDLNIKKEDIKRMQSVLYALAIKFLKRDQLKQVKERIGMSILGQMIWEDGMEKGVEEGIEKGITALILDNMEEGTPKGRIIEKLSLRFGMGQQAAESFYERIVSGEGK